MFGNGFLEMLTHLRGFPCRQNNSYPQARTVKKTVPIASVTGELPWAVREVEFSGWHSGVIISQHSYQGQDQECGTSGQGEM